VLVPVPKPDDTHNAASLTCHASKDIYNKPISVEQANFHTGHGTSDALIRSYIRNRPTFVLSVEPESYLKNRLTFILRVKPETH